MEIFYLAFLTVLILSLPLPVSSSESGYFGSKTPYPLESTDWDSAVREAQLPSSCQLIHFRFLARHGTRSLSNKKVVGTEAAVKEINQAVSSDPNIQRQLTEEQITAIKAWSNKLPPTKELLDRGKDEHRFHARNLFELVKKSALLNKGSPRYKFESTYKNRTRDSATAFKAEWEMLLGKDNSSSSDLTIEDDRLYFQKKCDAYKDLKDWLSDGDCACSANEMNVAKTTLEGSAIVEKVNREKFGFDSNILSWKDIFALYEMTGHEMAAFNFSVFTPIFDESDLEYLEYADDLEHYHIKGYTADPVTQKMSCVLVSHIFEKAAEAYKQSRLGNFDAVPRTFDFAHFETLQPVYAALGLFHDPKEAFRANASRHFYSHRKYDTSEIGKMASNMIFLFYDCPDKKQPKDKMVLLMVNGRFQPFPRACPFQLPCPFEDVQTAYPLITGYSKKCDFQEICSLEHNQGLSKQPKTIKIALAAILLITAVLQGFMTSVL